MENLCKILPGGVTSKKETGQRITLRNMASWRRDEPAKKYEAKFLKKCYIVGGCSYYCGLEHHR
jgi:hypothetical protein